MEVGFRGGEYIEEEARAGWNVLGGRGPVLFAVKRSTKNKEKIYILTLNGHRSKYYHATTNQKHASVLNDGTGANGVGLRGGVMHRYGGD